MKKKQLNKDWHLKNPMPKNASIGQRIAWHKEHVKVCGCRPVPAGLQKFMNA